MSSLLRPILVGMDNPYGGPPRLALWPDPPGSAGHRLCKMVLGLSKTRYLRLFERVNLCERFWSLTEARERALELGKTRVPKILLGLKVCEAFCVPFEPFTVVSETQYDLADRRLFLLPHPSGLSRAWNDPESTSRARVLLREFL